MEKLNFNGRVAVVTGAGKGLGRAQARALASRGARVVVNDVVAADADAVVDEIVTAGGQAIANHDDVRTGASQIVDLAVRTYGSLDILINNAGVMRAGMFGEQDSGEWWEVFDVTARGTIEATRAAWPHLVKSGTGRVINVASSGMLANPGASAYGAAKGAVWAFSNTLAAEGERVGINVATILPSAWTPMVTGSIPVDRDPGLADLMKQKMNADQVASFVAYLAHEDSKITGRAFRVVGGVVGEVALAGLSTVRSAEPAPEAWAQAADQIEATVDVEALYRLTSELSGADMDAADPRIAERLGALIDFTE